MNDKALQLITLVDPAHTDPARAVRCLAAAFDIDSDEAADMVLDVYHQTQLPRRTWSPHDEVIANGGVITSEVVLRMLEKHGQNQESKRGNGKK